jgi:hypothetical protein
MTPLEKIEDIFGIYASYPYNGIATCCLVSELDPGKNWREIVKQDSKPNEE